MWNSNSVQKARSRDHSWQIGSDSEGERDDELTRKAQLLQQSNSMYEGLKQRPTLNSRASNGMLQAVFGAMKFGKKRNSKSSVDSSTGSTPMNTRRLPRSPNTKRHLRSITKQEEVQETSVAIQIEMDTKRDVAMCKISDGPKYLFKMAEKGKVDEISNICDTQPERIKSRDEKGATILHHATSHGRITVMDYIISDQSGKELLEATDELELTPLFWAVGSDNGNSVDYLISRGANATVRNERGDSPILYSIRKNCMKALAVLLKYKGAVDVNQTQGMCQITPMHMAAEMDNDVAAKMLMEAGAQICRSCQQGYKPLHTAALNGSRKVMKLIIEKCEEHGYTSQQVLSFNDKELCSPLHCAVLGGNAEAIKLCLEYGARLDTQQADKSTPMHMVCAQGAQEVVESMFNLAREQATRTLSMQDQQRHTPLHKAAMYGHATIVHYLANQGADLDMLDCDQNTPLLLAASRGNWISVRDLVELGADFMIKNKDDRNFLHMVVLGGGDLRNLDIHCQTEDFKESCRGILKRPEVHDLLNQPDSVGCTPLHYACQEGNLASLETLMTLGVSAKLKSAGNQSPLHFAARYGRYNACKKLINSTQGPNIINEKDNEGMTPLHYAAENGHTKVVQLLLNKGAVCHRNIRGESVLHVTATNGYTRTIKILVAMNRTLLDSTDDEGNTPVHHATVAKKVNGVKLLLDLGCKIVRNSQGHTFFTYCIKNQNRDVALATVLHDRWEEAMQEFFKSKEAIYIPSLLLIQYLPDVWVTALNRCVRTSDSSPKSKEYWITYEFKYLQPNVNKREELKQKIQEVLFAENEGLKMINGKEVDEDAFDDSAFTLPALNKMVQYNRVECLRHPVSTAYLQMKWNAYGRWVHGLNLFIYILGLIPLTYLICTTNPAPMYHNEIAGTPNMTNRLQAPVEFSPIQTTMMIILTVLSCGQILKELVQMYQQKRKYFTDISNLIEWILYVSSILYVTPFFTGYPFHWQFEFGCVAILLAWFNLLLFFQRFDIAGIYVVMLLVILRTLVKVLAVFSFLIISFSLAFFILLNQEDDLSFSTPGLSLLRVITMTLGEINYVDKFLEPYVDSSDDTLHYSLATLILLVVFIVLMPILFMNLLIGLAVGDIVQVQSNAELQRLAMQVQLHTEIEGKLSTRLLRLVDKDELTIYPNKKCGPISRIFGKMTAKDEAIPEDSELPLSTTDRNISFLNTEIQKQKERLKDVQVTLNKQHDLLRLIVQKMEIRSEADVQDEGAHPNAYNPTHYTGNFQAVGGVVRRKIVAARAFKAIKN